MDDKDIVSAVRLLLVDKVGPDRFELWFGPSTRLSYVAGLLVVETPNEFFQNWLRSHYRGEIEAACRCAAGDRAVVEFRIDEALGQAPPQSCATRKPGEVEQDTPNNANAVNGKAVHAPESGQRPRLHQPASPRDLVASSTQPARSVRQSTAHESLPRRRFATLEAFVVGPGNRMAHASAQTAAERPGTFTPLLIYGPNGSGKTHLLEGIWSAARAIAGQGGFNAVYLSAEQYTTLFVEAVRGTGLPNFRRKYRGVHLLIIDDLQFLAGKQATLVELLHTMEAVLRDGRQLVFAADRAPRDLAALGPELVTRLSGGMVCRIDPPDLQTRCQLVRHFAARRQLEIPDDVANHVAAQLTAGGRELCGAVNRLDAARRMLGQPINMALAEEALGDILRDVGHPVCLADVERAVCDVFGLERDSLQSNRRSKSVSTPRMLAMWLARKHTRAGLAEIGRYFGRRSHSTVISAQKRVGDWLTRQSQIDCSSRPCKIDEAIRQVEEHLRTRSKRAG